ncbi:MAG: hypothetical protein ABL879_11165 [Devosia sp.]
MLDRYAARNVSSVAPAANAFAITPNDSTDLEELCRALYVGSAGNISVVLKLGATVTFVGVPAGSILPVRAVRVRATGTTAGSLLGLV